jgi:hypothetical protein
MYRRVQTGSGAHPQWVTGSLSLKVNWKGCETDHSPASCAEVKNVWCLVKHSDFTLTFFRKIFKKNND